MCQYGQLGKWSFQEVRAGGKLLCLVHGKALEVLGVSGWLRWFRRVVMSVRRTGNDSNENS